MQNKFRASYTVLSMWKSGNWQGAIEQYFKLRQFTTEAMATGKDQHETWATDIEATKRLPACFGGKELTAPKIEEKIVVDLAEWLEFVFIRDCYDSPILYEFKTGIRTSESYASTAQHGMYAVGSTFAGDVVDRAEIHHFNQHSGKSDMSMVWVSDKMLDEYYNLIITLSSEMHNYLSENDLYSKLGSKT